MYAIGSIKEDYLGYVWVFILPCRSANLMLACHLLDQYPVLSIMLLRYSTGRKGIIESVREATRCRVQVQLQLVVVLSCSMSHDQTRR